MNIFLISGLLSSGPNVDTDGSEEITTASDTDTTMSDSVDVTLSVEKLKPYTYATHQVMILYYQYLKHKL